MIISTIRHNRIHPLMIWYRSVSKSKRYDTSEILKKQNELYTLFIRHPDGKIKSQVIDAIIDFLLGPDQPEQVISRLAHQDTYIVSLTITEGGYNINPAAGDLNFDNPDIIYELEHPDEPKNVYG